MTPAKHSDPQAQWLVRTAENVIAGPYSRDQICELVQHQEIGEQDEVCPANGYWIYLHERDEVRRQLGIEVPAAPRADGVEEEITETDTLVEIDDLPELSENPDAPGSGETSMIQNRAFRQFQPRKVAAVSAPRPAAPAPVQVFRGLQSGERTQLWWGVVLLLGLLGLGVLVLVWRLLQQH